MRNKNILCVRLERDVFKDFYFKLEKNLIRYLHLILMVNSW